MIRFLKFPFVAALMFLCGGCGGGGGEGGGNGADTTGVRFIHAALESSPRQIVSDGVGLTEFVIFGSSSGFKKAGSGLKNIRLLGRSGDTESLPPLQINDDARVDIVLFQGASESRAVAFIHPSFSGRGARIINAVRTIDGGVASVTMSGAGATPFGTSSEYLGVGNSVTVNVFGTTRELSLPLEGRLFTLVALGEAGYLTKIVLLQDE